MGPKDKELRDPSELAAVLDDALICRLGIRDGEGVRILPMNFGHRDGRLYFHTGKTGTKLELLARNPSVSFEAEADVAVIRGTKGCNWSMSYRSVMGRGEVEFLDDPEEKQEALAIITSHYGGPQTEYPERAVAETVVFSVAIQSMTGKRVPPRAPSAAASPGSAAPRVEHVAIWTHALEPLRDFYVDHFGATAGERYRNPEKGFESVFLSLPAGPRLELMSRTGLAARDAGQPRPGYAHLAFSVGSAREVDAMTERLRASGVPVVDGPRRTGDGYYESVVLDPDGNHIEITADA